MSGDPMDVRRCTAKSKRSGDRCKRVAIVGGTVCSMHGGKAPAVKAAADERTTVAAAEERIRSLWSGLDAAQPVKDPVGSMERLAGALEQLVDEAGRRVSELQHVAGGKDLTQLRAEVTLLERALGHLRGLLVDMARLGLAERHVELEQERAQMVTAAFLSALAAVSLVPADRDLMLRTFLQGLGRGPEELEATAGGAA